MKDVTFLVIGWIVDPPKDATINYFDMVPKGDAVGLYVARQKAVASVRTKYFCFLDGQEDRLLPCFIELLTALKVRMDTSGAPIGYMGELVNGHDYRFGQAFQLHKYLHDFTLIHHGVLCRTSFFQSVAWPRGNYSYEIYGYGFAAQAGFEYSPAIGYAYNQGPTGARLWPAYQRAAVNSLGALQGLPGVHTPAEMATTCGPCKTIRQYLRQWFSK